MTDTFTKVFSYTSPDPGLLQLNKRAVSDEAIARGLKPTGDVTFTTEVRDYPNATIVTYSVPVESTPDASPAPSAPVEPAPPAEVAPASDQS
jgi:hypothetical protein